MDDMFVSDILARTKLNYQISDARFNFRGRLSTVDKDFTKSFITVLPYAFRYIW